MEDPLTKHKNVQWLKNKLMVVWNSSNFCGMCLDNTGNLNSVHLEFLISNQKETKSLVEVLNYVFNDDIENVMSSTYICDFCTEKTIQSYLFIYSTKNLLKILSNCVTDIYSKIEFISDGSKKAILLLENDTELYKEIDNIIAITERVPADKPTVMKHIVLEPEKHTVEEKHNDPFKTTTIKSEIDINLPVYNLQIPDRTLNISSEKGKIVVQPIKCLMDDTLEPMYTKYECRLCPDIFITDCALKEHEKVKHNLHMYVCDLCNATYNKQHYLNMHYNKCHSLSYCKYCEIKVRDKDLSSHLKQHHADSIYPCSFCELVYHSQQSLKIHLKRIHLKEKETTWQCKCLKQILTELEVKGHHCKVACTDCLATPCIHFKYLVQFRKQIMNNAKAKCVECNYTTDNRQSLLTHVNRVHLNYHPFECNYCGLQFYTKRSLKNHIVRFHMDNKICEYCDEEFNDKKVLSEHMKSCKEIIRQFKCNKCVASFNIENDCTKHEYLRHGGGGYACKFCNRRFLEKKYLKRHKIAAHNSLNVKKLVSNIECTLCDIKFDNIKEMEQHKELHGPNTVYPCKECSQQFYCLNKLHKHQLRHSRNKEKIP